MEYDFDHGHKELYATQPKEPGRAKEASDWYRVNPHRLHLGIIGLELGNEVRPSDVQNIQQSLDMWNGIINSRFTLKETPYYIQTVCHPERDMIAARLSARQPAGIKFHFPYPTGGHCDDACNWEANDKHSTTLVSEDAQSAVLKRTLDATTYYVTISWEGPAKLSEKSANYFVLTPTDSIFTFTCQFTPQVSASPILTFTEVQQASSGHWKNYWTQGAVADFSQCTDVRAKELERRVVLSQYLLAIQCAGSTPPQEPD